MDPSPAPRPSTRLATTPRIAAAAVALALLAAGACTSSSIPPAPTPADFGGISLTLQRRGLTIVDVVSGDAGCPDANLARTAISFRASGLDQANPVRVYLYIFNNHDAFVRRSTDVGGCARSYVTDPGTYENLAVSPYVVSGQGPWGTSFVEQLRAGLSQAAGDGGTSTGGGE